MAYRLHFVQIWQGKNKFGNAKGRTECVEFVRQITGAPNSANWRKGKQVKDAKAHEILPGTAIATFDDNDKYPSDGLGRHAAIYLSHNSNGFHVLDQWNSQDEVKDRIIFFNKPMGTTRSNNGDTFYVIE